MSITHPEAPETSSNFPLNPPVKSPRKWTSFVFTFPVAFFAAKKAKKAGFKTGIYWLLAGLGSLTWVLAAFALTLALFAAVGGGNGSSNTQSGNHGTQSVSVNPSNNQKPVVTKPKGVPIQPLAVTPTDTVKAIQNYLYTAYTTGTTASLADYCYTPTSDICSTFYSRAQQGFPGKFVTNVISVKENTAGTQIDAKITITYTPVGGPAHTGEVTNYTYLARNAPDGSGLRFYFDHVS